MERDKIISVLRAEGYPEYMFDGTIDKIEKFQGKIAFAFSKWMDDGEYPLFSVEGFTYSQLVQRYGMKPIGAFITLDWLRREPDKAKEALKRGVR